MATKKLQILGELSTSEFIGATAETDGTKGVVPAPVSGDQDKYLCADGSWSDIILPGEETTTETIGSMDIHVDTADTAYDAEKLGGVSAAEYALKSELSELGGLASLNRVMISLPSSGWIQEPSGRYTQTVMVGDITSHSKCHHVDVDMSGATEENINDIKQAWSLIDNVEATDAGVLFTAFSGAPAIDFSVYIDIEVIESTVPNANGVIF